MPSLMAVSVEYGGYVSVVKFCIVILTFFAWVPLVNWVHTDGQAVRTRHQFWMMVISAAGAIGLLVWLIVPIFLIGMLCYIVAVGAASMAYIIHRNARVADFERTLTFDFFKGLFVNEDKKIAKISKGLSFITANKNEVPMPLPKSPDAAGFRVACEFFDDAIWRRTNIITFVPGAQEYGVIYHIDGETIKQAPKQREEMEYFVKYLKMLADLDINEKRKPQKGVFKVLKDAKSTNWELSTAGSTAGEQINLTKIEQYGIMTVGDLGLNEDQTMHVESLNQMTNGAVIISGLPQSGLTSTLYTLLRRHDPFMNSINTLEKQPATELQNITQHRFSLSDTGSTTYSKKLQTILRMGPDIMGVESCDDAQCASLVSAAARDGMVLYVTLEATDVIHALGKWLKMVPDKNLVADTLKAIINQRLIRKLCSECKQAYQPNQDLFRKFNISSDQIKILYRPGEIEYDKHGKPIVCEHCQGTGFSGRIGIFEIIYLTDELKDTIKKAQNLQEISAQFRKSGMLYMQEQAIKKVVDGVTSINEVIRKFSSEQKS